ncbi:hypothetical protein [Evansella clarkii]|uniref:hypothetical protein n=1 Tax=Evansella clarkii TaxID=79879 RepID=UPI001C48FE6B|nr:hypothetical protein [Evansella clarkii]
MILLGEWVKISENRIQIIDKGLKIPVFTSFKLIDGEIYGKLEGYKVAPEKLTPSYYQH